jgi:indolepyruvate ferredoxin oxidoreductase alpha subunit
MVGRERNQKNNFRAQEVNKYSYMKKEILLGNEAIVRGALESGVDFVSTYPGTPASEIGNIFFKIAKDRGVYFEFSTNEKVALEVAIGASFSGLKCLVAMKSFGLNVCSDSLLPLAYTGTKGPMVIVAGDDPSCWSSGQSEENTRGYAYLSHLPMLEPADPQEAKDFTKLAFEISEKFNLPVILRTTTRVAHQRMPVACAPNQKSKIHAYRQAGKNQKDKGVFVKNVHQFVTMPPRVLEMKKELLEKIEKIRQFAEKSPTNSFGGHPVSPKFGIIASGVSYLYVKEALVELNLDIPILKLGFFYPLPENKIKNFIKNLKKVLIVEELEPYLEKEVARLAKDVNPKLEIFGKNILPEIGELNQQKIALAIAKSFNKKLKIKNSLEIRNLELEIPKRFPRLCQGCPYWFIFSAIKKTAPEGTIFGGDIGCYMLAGYAPHNIQDYLLNMGSSIGIGHGVKKATKNQQKVIALIGDSTFFHAGIPALINAVFNKSNILIIVMDNRITAMTGHQPTIGTCDYADNQECVEIKIEDIAKASGVKNLKVIQSSNIRELQETIKDFLEKPEVSMIVARQTCALLAKRLEKQNLEKQNG